MGFVVPHPRRVGRRGPVGAGFRGDSPGVATHERQQCPSISAPAETFGIQHADWVNRPMTL